MNFNLDSYIELGKSHEVCEDYATHGTIMGVPYIIVSDGCSSSKDTDVGSRLLVHACRNALSELLNHNLIEDLGPGELRAYIKAQVLFNLKLSLKALCLKDTVSDATLLFAFVWENNLYTFMYGDGHIITKKIDGTLDTYKIHYTDNAPPYISYDLDIRRKNAYLEQFGKGDVVFTSTSQTDETNSTTIVNSSPLEEWVDKLAACRVHVQHADNIQSITLASDGIESYMFGKSTNATPEERANVSNESMWQKEYTSYKGVGGEFVKRRMKRIKLNNEKLNIEHFDDVSCATIWINHE